LTMPRADEFVVVWDGHVGPHEADSLVVFCHEREPVEPRPAPRLSTVYDAAHPCPVRDKVIALLLKGPHTLEALIDLVEAPYASIQSVLLWLRRYENLRDRRRPKARLPSGKYPMGRPPKEYWLD
jgi:hypothetical protein